MKIIYTENSKSKHDLFKYVEEAVSKSQSNKLISWDDIEIPKNSEYSSVLSTALEEIDVVVANFSKGCEDVSVEVGFALALKKPVILLCPIEEIDELSPNLFSAHFIAYDRNRIGDTLTKPLTKFLTGDSLESLIEKIKVEKKIKKTVFVSYCHTDIKYLERLNIHMKPFERKGLVEFWSDTKINAGDKWKESIQNSLENAAIAILLISADFLASDFIVDNELPPLLRGAEENGKVILPVILKPCRFTKEENLSLFHSVNDPKNPISKMNETEQEEVFVKIVDIIDTLL